MVLCVIYYSYISEGFFKELVFLINKYIVCYEDEYWEEKLGYGKRKWLLIEVSVCMRIFVIRWFLSVGRIKLLWNFWKYLRKIILG